MDKLLTLILIISAILLYGILLYLHILLYVALPKKLGGAKTFLYFTCFVGYWLLLIYLLTENMINFTGATLLIALSCIPELFILRERVSKDIGMLIDKLHLRKRRLFVIAICSVIAFAAHAEAGWLVYYEPALNGTILDFDSKQPIECVVIAVEYSKSEFGGPGGQISSVIKTRETLTDKNGHFHIPSYITLIQPLSWKIPNGVAIYKPGYISLHLGTWHFNGDETKEVLEQWSKGVEWWFTGLKFRLDANGVVEIPRTRTPEQRQKEQNNLIFTTTLGEKTFPILWDMINTRKLPANCTEQDMIAPK